jgi:general secretion pathway protein F
MPAYQFEALSEDGATRKGVIEADSAKSARGALRLQSLIPLSVETLHGADGKSKSLLQRDLFNAKVFGNSALTVLTRQLAGLVTAGLPLERALAALAEEAPRESQRNLLSALRADVNGGSTFAKALSEHPREFSNVFVAVIGSGEQGGNLGLVLERLADDLEEQQTLKSKLIGAALYPGIVSLVAIVIVMFLLSYVVPQVASVFAGSKRTLPWLTSAMLALSAFVRGYGWWALAVVVLASVGAAQALKQPALRLRFDAFWLRLPIIGHLASHYNAARFAGTLAMLSSAGVPILKAMQTAAATLSNHAMRADLEDALVMVREGASLASAVAQKKRFPGLLSMFARLGEQTGQLPVMLGRCAQQLSNDVQRRAMALATILEPLLIVLMGLFVMLIVLAVLMPIIQLNQLVN